MYCCRNLSLFYFILVHDSYRAEHVKERRLWTLLGLLCRVYSMPENEFNQWRSGSRKLTLNNAAKEVITLVKRLYGETCCSYNLHHLLHLDQIRLHGPFPSSSAFSTEAYYANIRKSVMFKHSKNIGKQILSDTYSSYTKNHSCQRTMTFAADETQKTADNYCYIFDEREQEYEFYKIIEVGETDVTALTVITTSIGSSVNLTRVGFRKYLMALRRNERKIEKKSITGKAIRINQYIASCSKLTLFEAN